MLDRHPSALGEQAGGQGLCDISHPEISLVGPNSCLEAHRLESKVPTVRVLSLPSMQLGFLVEGWLNVLGDGRILNDR